jgi:hypothetical protein
VRKITTYLRGFENWAGLRAEFKSYSAPESPVPAKEPRYVYAMYDADGYEGSALVIYSDDGETFIVNSSSHCSCYGLDETWAPDEHPFETLSFLIDRGEYGARYEGLKEWAKRVRRSRTRREVPDAPSMKTLTASQNNPFRA